MLEYASVQETTRCKCPIKTSQTDKYASKPSHKVLKSQSLDRNAIIWTPDSQTTFLFPSILFSDPFSQITIQSSISVSKVSAIDSLIGC